MFWPLRSNGGSPLRPHRRFLAAFFALSLCMGAAGTLATVRPADASSTTTYHAFDQGPGATLRHLWYDTSLGWLSESLDVGSSTGGYTTTAVASSGGLNVFNQGNGPSLRHLWLDSGGWHAETLDPNTGSGTYSTGAYNFAIVASTGGFQEFNQGSGGVLRHLWYDSGGWHAETLDGPSSSNPNYSTGAYISGAVASSGGLNIFNQGNGGVLRHLWYDSGGWHAETLDTPSSSNPNGSTGAWTSAAVSKSDGSFNVFNQGAGGVLRHLFWSNGWAAETLDATGTNNVNGSTGAYTSVAVASTGGWNVFDQGTGGVLRHLWWAPGWAAETLDSGTSSGAYTVAGLASTGGFQVFNQATTVAGGLGLGLRHGWYDSGGWHFETLDTPLSFGDWTSGTSPTSSTTVEAAPSPTASPSPQASVLWGVDSADTVNNQLANTQTFYGQPYFWGRYLGGSFGMTSSEVGFAHQNSIKILVIDDQFSSATGSTAGSNAASAIISQAKSFGIPAGIAIFADVEAGYSVDSSWIKAWFDTFEQDGTYAPAYYGNPITGGFNSAYCGAVQAESAINSKSIVWSSEPEPGRTKKSNMPYYGPDSPSCSGQVPAWQYGEPSSGGQSGANIDTDELKSTLSSNLW